MNFRNQLVLILSLLGIFLFNCDQKTSKKEQLEKSVAEFKQSFELTETKRIYPEFQTRIETDSLIANTFKVKIENYSTVDSFIALPHNSTEHKFTHHRTYKSDILVMVKDDLVLKRHISAANFSLNSSKGFLDKATLEQVWVNQERSDSEFLSLGISFVNPISKAYKLYEMRIDKLGNETINLIEETS